LFEPVDWAEKLSGHHMASKEYENEVDYELRSGIARCYGKLVASGGGQSTSGTRLDEGAA
jgi:hypothetical protein